MEIHSEMSVRNGHGWRIRVRVFMALAMAVALSALTPTFSQAQAGDSDRLILISLDGVRTQEIFLGLDEELLMKSNEGKKKEDVELYRRFHGSTPEESRAKLMPFLWNEWIPGHGAILGNRHRENGVPMKLVNRRRFSYPGYAEILTGSAHDEEITSNDKIQNPFPTVMDYLRQEWELSDTGIAAFSSWDVIPFIVSREAGSIFTNGGFQHYQSEDPRIRVIDEAQFEQPTPWDSVRHDFTTFSFAMDFLKKNQPRALYLSLGETDDWAHMDRYDMVLDSLYRTDKYLRQLWAFLQSSPFYRNRTTVILCTDHGRGDNIYNWSSHNSLLPGAEFVWMAAFAPGIKHRGEWDPQEPATQSQIAATLCATAGLDITQFIPEASGPVKGLISKD
jgi:hypothetical protein